MINSQKRALAANVALAFLVTFGAGLGSPAAVSGQDEVQAANPPAPVLGVSGSRFTLNATPMFLYGISYYGALAASEESIRLDLDEMRRGGFNWLRVWANWTGFGSEASVVESSGSLIPAKLQKLKELLRECARRGMIVDVTLTRDGFGTGAEGLGAAEAHRRAVESLVEALKTWPNWYLDLSNERNIGDRRHTSIRELQQLRELVRSRWPALLVTASHGGDISREELREYLETVKVDFISPHRPRDAQSAAQTERKTREYLSWMRDLGRVIPIQYQEPFRRGYADWNPTAEDFATDLRGAMVGGAAGWCFHNGAERTTKDGQPRRSFDLRAKRLFPQLDPEEQKSVERLAAIAKARLPEPGNRRGFEER